MNERVERRSYSRALLLLLVPPLLVLVAVAYFALTARDEGGTPLARGSSGGVFHPVAGSFVSDETALKDCGDGEYACLEQAFGNIAYRGGPKAALTLFDERITKEGDVRADCHRIAHTIGSAAFALFEGSVARTFSQGSATCASGYYHGVLERAFVGISSKAKLAEVSKSLCVGEGIRRRGFLDYQCRHGLGHGFMIQTGYDLPFSLSLCAELGTRWDGVSCTGGVFMENLNTKYSFRSPWLNDDDPLYPCERVPARHRRSCYLRAPSRLVAFHRSDLSKVAAACAKVDARWIRACFRGYGRDAVTEARFELKKTTGLCRLAGQWSGECWRGAARTVGDRAGTAGAKPAARFCERSPRADRRSCFAGVGIVVGLLYPTHAAKRRMCAELAGKYARVCARTAIAAVHPDGREAWG